MLVEPAVLPLSLAYLGLLFAVAYFGDRHARDWSAKSTAPTTVADQRVLPIKLVGWSAEHLQSSRL